MINHQCIIPKGVIIISIIIKSAGAFQYIGTPAMFHTNTEIKLDHHLSLPNFSIIVALERSNAMSSTLHNLSSPTNLDHGKHET
jgi:hypothetical protein